MTITNKKILSTVIANNYVVIAKVIIGVVALFAGAQIVIPLKPVPIIMNTVLISIIAFTYSSRLSFVTVLAYITAGIVGLPMFSKMSGGLDYFLGTTCGYFIGFLIATPVMSILKNKFSKEFTGAYSRHLSMFCACLVGHIIIYFLGVSWLATIIGVKQAIYSGFIIFIPTGLVKILIFSSIYSYIKGRKNVL
ncbi:biotin transporter BioY [Candidatus Tisiphia endosymbiont of Hybos culiciformis]|uniref:biotin transporter BioY n=1 Tax=Candidatus Tisiphia endosymbiont of Hybos culiciformis TaxID=3139331 RepID=UPI003CCB6A7C